MREYINIISENKKEFRTIATACGFRASNAGFVKTAFAIDPHRLDKDGVIFFLSRDPAGKMEVQICLPDGSRAFWAVKDQAEIDSVVQACVGVAGTAMWQPIKEHINKWIKSYQRELTHGAAPMQVVRENQFAAIENLLNDASSTFNQFFALLIITEFMRRKSEFRKPEDFIPADLQAKAMRTYKNPPAAAAPK